MNETKTYQKFKNSPQDNFPSWIVIHHSGGTKADSNADTSHHTAIIMEKGHMEAPNFFEGLGYQYVIEKDGKIWKGRPEHYHGAHVKEQNINIKSIGICLAGNFTVKGRTPTEEQKNALAELVASIKTRYSIPGDRIVPHRTFLGNPPYKDCYGDQLSDDWARNLLTPVAPTTPKDILLKRVAELKTLIENL